MESNQGVSSAPEITSSDAEHKKLLEQLKRAQVQNKELVEVVQKYNEQQKMIEEKKLIESGEVQKILELRDREANELKQKLEVLGKAKDEADRTVADTWKLQAFYEKLPGKIKRRDYLGYVPLDKIAFDPTTGDIDIRSVDEAVNTFMEKYPELVDTKAFGRIPGEAAQMNISQLTPERFKDIPLKEMRLKAAEAVRLAKKKL